jgi:hypothetical protein
VKLRAQALVEGHEGEDVMLRVIHQLGHIPEPVAEVFSDLALGRGLIMSWAWSRSFSAKTLFTTALSRHTWLF